MSRELYIPQGYKSALTLRETQHAIKYIKDVFQQALSFALTLDIGAGPLTYIGEALSAALGLFGISVYVVNRVGQMRNEIHAEMDQIRRERHGYDTTRSTEE